MPTRNSVGKFPPIVIDDVKKAILDNYPDGAGLNTKIVYRAVIKSFIDYCKNDLKVATSYSSKDEFRIELALCCRTAVFMRWLRYINILVLEGEPIFLDQERNLFVHTDAVCYSFTKERCSKCALYTGNWYIDSQPLAKIEAKLLQNWLKIALKYMEHLDNKTFWDLSDAIEEIEIEEELLIGST